MLLYLSKHHKHIDSVQLKEIEYKEVRLRPLPTNLQLYSLQLDWVHLQVQLGDGLQGVLRAPDLKQLRLHKCRLDGVGADALSHLPARLEHLSIHELCIIYEPFQLSTGMLQQLQQLTYLELACIKLQGPAQDANALQPLQALTGLVDLRLVSIVNVQFGDGDILTASILAGINRLTCLALRGCKMEPGVLAGKTQLQRLNCLMVNISGGAAGV